MAKVSWTPERVQTIQTYMKDKNVTLEQASKQLKFGMATYYKYKNNMSTGKRKYTKRQAPITLELASPTQKNKIVFIIADRSQARDILNEVF